MNKTLDQILDYYKHHYFGETTHQIAEAQDITTTLAIKILQALFDFAVSVVAAEPLMRTQEALDARRMLGYLIVSNPWLAL